MRSMFFLPRPTCALSQRLAKSGHHDTVSGLLTGSQGSPLNESVSSSSLAVRLSEPAPASSPVGDASLELAPASLSTFWRGVAPAVDGKRCVWGKSVSVRVDFGGGRSV